MSINLSRLAGRHDLQDGLFARLVEGQPRTAGPTPAQIRDLAEQFLVGESVIYGASSCYDELRPEGRRRARICNGSSCLAAGTQDEVQRALAAALPASEIGHVTCLGRCHENRSFQLV